MINQAELNGLANIEAEQSVLGAIMLEPELIRDAFVKADYFYEHRHKVVFEAMLQLREKNITVDVITLVEQLIGQLEEVGGLTYLTELAGAMPTTASFTHYQGIITHHYERRMMHNIAQKLMSYSFEQEPASARNEIINALQSLDDLSGGDDKDDGHIKHTMLKIYEWMEQDHGDVTGARTGFRDLDNMLSGLQRQDLVIVGARPSMGKTAFAINICQNYALGAAKGDGGPAAVFSLEMPDEGLGKRMITSEGNINAIHMRNPLQMFDDSEWNKATNALANLSNAPLHIFDKSSVDISYIRKKCRMLTRKYPGEHLIVVIDYLQLIQGDPKFKGNRVQEIGAISRDLKLMARELDITVVALSQLSRAVEQRQDKRPMLSDLRESGGIEQDADVIAFLYRDDYYDKESESKDLVEIIIGKQRNGPVGTVTLAFKKDYNKFLNLDWSNTPNA